MDAYTTRGKVAREYEDEAIEELEKAFENTFARFPNEKPMDFDGFIIEDSEIRAMYEARSRDAGFIEGQLEYKSKKYDTVMVTHDKILRCQKYSKKFGIPFLFLVIFVQTRNVICFQITDERGDELIDYEVKETKSQKTINGGVAFRKNAFLPLSEAIVWL